MVAPDDDRPAGVCVHSFRDIEMSRQGLQPRATRPDDKVAPLRIQASFGCTKSLELGDDALCVAGR